MKSKRSRFRWIVCIATLLVLCIVSSDKPMMGAEQASSVAVQCPSVVEDASGSAIFSDPESDIFARLRDTNRWGISSNMLHLRVSTGRTLSFSSLSQRIVRMALVCLSGNTPSENLNYAQCHTIASIRFHIGYFIYHRCQMRC